MALVALFYRATLLDFEERVALVSKRLYLDQEDGKLTPANVRVANDLRAEFLHFSNYWYFDELANKDEEIEHFTLQCQQYRIEPVKREIEEEIEKLNASIFNYFQTRNTEAVNRLAMLSLIVGAGAVLTGFFGMNFGRWFSRVFFEPDPSWLAAHYAAVATVFLFAFGALAFGVYLVFSHWTDYRDIFIPHGLRTRRETTPTSLRKT
jgi:Mg2+ and Co2+ transporter CorA